LGHIVNDKIGNMIFLSGDSHANWVFDTIRDNQTDYDPVSGCGALGVEFAGTAVSSSSPYGANSTYNDHKNITDFFVGINKELL
jgi:alkaline phosphatase D